MSYLHCPTCQHAFNIAVHSTCPSCPVPAQVVDPAEDIVSAAEQLARAMARATPDERDEAMARMDRLALPAPGARPSTFHGATLRSIRVALDPPALPSRPVRRVPLLERVANRLLDRLAPTVLPALDRVAPRAQKLGAGLRARVRALAA